MARMRVATSRPCTPNRGQGRLVAIALVLLAFCGCRSTKNYDLIEAELRTRNNELAAARAELSQTRSLNQIYQRTHSAPNGDPANCGPVPMLPLKEVILGSGTGGADNDDLPGDEGLQIVLVPKDDDGSAVKVPGRVEVLAYEVRTSGTKNLISRWDIPPDQLRRTWRGGLFATGYYLPLKWDRAPSTERVRIAVRLTTLDGRPYEADRDVTVRVLPGVGSLPPDFAPPGGGFLEVPPQDPSFNPAPMPDSLTIPPPSSPLPAPRNFELPSPTRPPPTELPAPKLSESRRPAVRMLPARPDTSR